jgi:hypothetical protein
VYFVPVWSPYRDKKVVSVFVRFSLRRFISCTNKKEKAYRRSKQPTEKLKKKIHGYAEIYFLQADQIGLENIADDKVYGLITRNVNEPRKCN